MKSVLGRGLESLIPSRPIGRPGNAQMHALDALDEAESFRLLLETEGLTQERLSKQIGKSRPHVTNTLRLLRLPEKIKFLLRGGKLSPGHARALLSLEDEHAAVQLAERTAAEKISVRQVEELVRHRITPRDPKRTTRLFDREVEKSLEMRIRVLKKRKGGKIEISCASSESLEELITSLSRLSPLV